jgi:hypothetical protein
MNKSFNINIEFDATFSIEELWPDGDAPENPTIEDVKNLICKDLNTTRDNLEKQNIDFRELLMRWGFEDEGYLTISDYSPMTDAKAHDAHAAFVERFRQIGKKRSGEYKQGKGFLCQTDEEGQDQFCPLGILADIAIDGYWEKHSTNQQYWRLGSLKYYYSPFNMPISYNCNVWVISAMNDSNYSFEEMADWIEKNIPA